MSRYLAYSGPAPLAGSYEHALSIRTKWHLFVAYQIYWTKRTPTCGEWNLASLRWGHNYWSIREAISHGRKWEVESEVLQLFNTKMSMNGNFSCYGIEENRKVEGTNILAVNMKVRIKEWLFLLRGVCFWENYSKVASIVYCKNITKFQNTECGSSIYPQSPTSPALKVGHSDSSTYGRFVH